MKREQDISLYDMLRVWRQWWKALLLFPLLITGIALLVAWLLPKQYHAATTVLPVNSMLTDRARLFADHVEQLYANFGTADDLDRLYTIASAGNVLGFVVDSLNLALHYQSPGAGEAARSRAVKTLKTNVSITKTANGALEVAVWDKTPATAAAIANLVIEKTEALYRELNTSLNQRTADALRSDNMQKRAGLGKAGNMADTADRNRQRRTLEQLERNERLLDEIVLNIQTATPPLVVLEKAYPAVKPGKPDMPFIALATLLLSAFFTAMVVLTIERKRNHAAQVPSV